MVSKCSLDLPLSQNLYDETEWGSEGVSVSSSTERVRDSSISHCRGSSYSSMTSLFSRASAGAGDEVRGSSFTTALQSSRPPVGCTLVDLPEEYEKPFSYLQGTCLFFFDVIQKISRIGVPNKRVLFITDHTINIASLRGGLSRCAKVEDIAELIYDAKKRTIGVRVRNRPFAIASDDPIRRNCFYEMSVDFLLQTTSRAQYEGIVHVLSCVYHTCTSSTLVHRQRKAFETWHRSLILAPDGLRVKKVIQYCSLAPARPRAVSLGGSGATGQVGTSTGSNAANPPREHRLQRYINPLSRSASRQGLSSAERVSQRSFSRNTPSSPFNQAGGGAQRTMPVASTVSTDSYPSLFVTSYQRSGEGSPPDPTGFENPLCQLDRDFDRDVSGKKVS